MVFFRFKHFFEKGKKSPLLLALFAIVGNLHFESFRNRNGQERQLQINSRDVLVSIVEEFVERGQRDLFVFWHLKLGLYHTGTFSDQL